MFIFSLFFILLDARENPFFPSEGEKDILITSNESMDKEPLKRATITLPPQARILKKVTLEFKNLDGSIESRSIELENSVDWHLPVFISQSYTETKDEVNLQSPTNRQIYKNIASIKHLSLSSFGKNLKLTTKDKAIRNFLLVNPHRVVVDFKKDTDIRSYVKKIPNAIFKEIRIGNHNGYYRAVIELDGHYRYEFKKISEGYLIELK